MIRLIQRKMLQRYLVYHLSLKKKKRLLFCHKLSKAWCVTALCLHVIRESFWEKVDSELIAEGGKEG